MDITQYWYRRSWHCFTILLLPFAGLFWLIISLRRFLYRTGLLKTYQAPIPVIVVGNVSVGGTGKTPFVIWLVNMLQAAGHRPGIVSRGVGRKRNNGVHSVVATDCAEEVGDEALLLQQTGCPVVIGNDRVAAVKTLLAMHACTVIVSDDGLQHYRLARQLEVVMVDGQREFGNGLLLPAGPLRETKARAKQADIVIAKEGNTRSADFVMSLVAQPLTSLVQSSVQKNLKAFAGQTVHAVAGIGNPERFFEMLEQAGLNVIRHPFRDHQLYCAKDFQFANDLPIMMTEKDAVKCKAFADERFWYLPITASLDEAVKQKILSQLKA